MAGVGWSQASWQQAVRPWSPPSTDLIGEVHRAKRRRRGRKAGRIALVVAAAAALLVAGKLGVDFARVHNGLVDAREHLTRGTQGDLEDAMGRLEGNLSIAPEHAESLTLLAVVNAQLTIESPGHADDAKAAIARAAQLTEAPELDLARAMVAGSQGDVELVRTALANEDTADNPVARRQRAWLQALVVLSEPGRNDGIADALTGVETALFEDPDWVHNRRMAAALRARLGQFDAALQQVATGRQTDPQHLGLAADETLVHALAGRELAGVEQAANALLDRGPALAPPDRARVVLARGLSRLHEGDRDDGLADLGEAFAELPAWDFDSRERALEATLTVGATEQAKSYGEAVSWPVADGPIIAAWIQFAAGEVPQALDALSGQPQDHPRTAYVQGLALLEQRRFAEAGAWIARAHGLLPGRPELDVAAARVRVAAGEVGPATQTLEAIAKAHPHAPRVWTALAEAHIANDPKDPGKDARKMARRAVAREVLPAEANLILARLDQRVIAAQPERAWTALENLKLAAEAGPHLPRYRAAYGRQLAYVGKATAGLSELQAAASQPGVTAEDLVRLSRLAIKVSPRDEKVQKQASHWLVRAEKLAGPVVDIEVERARIELARGTQDGVALARARVERILAKQPGDIEARLIHVDALIAQGDLDTALLSVRLGVRKTLMRLDGRLYLAWSRVERASSTRKRDRRRATRRAFRGWRKMVAEPSSPAELLAAADYVSRLWFSLDQPRGARSVGRDLVRRAPKAADAWVIRSRIQMKADYPGPACDSSKTAVELDPEDPAAHAARGGCFAHFGDSDRARKAYQTATKLAAGTPAAKRYRRKLRKL